MEGKLIKNILKDEKSMATRLQSIRMPRDLNLGGTKVKKSYTPNLNVVRNKDKSKEFMKKNEPKIKQRFKREDGNKQNNNRQPKFVQSSGVFSEGVGGDVTRQRMRKSYKDTEERASMPVPTIKKSDWDVDRKTEDNVLDDIMGSDEEFEDVKFGLQPITWNEQDFKPPPAPKVSIKTEEGPAIEISKLSIKMPEASEYKQEFYSNDNPSLSIWNLPDSFAGKGLSDDPKVTKLFDYSLKDMLEGQIGKFIVRKSGRVQVQIGRIIYDLDTSECTSHMEEVVNFSDDASTMDAAVLGEISNSYILNPDWESLLRQQ